MGRARSLRFERVPSRPRILGYDRSLSSKRRLLADPGVATTKAARSGHILILPRKVFLSMSHNVIELIESLADALYTEEA